jgi:glycerophosphoryl diester phosphodiesterase
MTDRHALLAALLSVFLLAWPTARAEDGGKARAASAVRIVIAHRGSSIDRPENTLAGVRRAIEAGATAVEVDVRTSRDGVLVCLHDADLNRTTDGKGKVGAHTLAQLKALDAGAWFSPKYKGERIPTVPEVLRLCRGKIDVMLDLKESGEGYARKVAAEVRASGDPRRTLLGVRSVEQAKLLRKLLPDARQIGLIPATTDIDAFAGAGVEIIRLWPRWLGDESLVTRLRKHEVGLLVGAGKGTKKEVVPLLTHRPAALSSDDPARLRKTLAEIAKGGR